MRTCAVAVLIMLAIAGGARAETTDSASTEAEVSARLAGQPLLLRGFWADDKLEFDSDGKPIANYRVGSFTEAGFAETGVKIKGDHLTIEGQRMGIEFVDYGMPQRVQLLTSGKKNAPPEKITIEIDGHGNSDFSKELDAIFASRLRDVVETMPDYWQKFARKNFLDEDDLPTKTKEVTVDPAKPFHVGGSVTPPKLLKQVDPEFDEAARRMKYSGTSEIYFWLEPDGTPSHISIAKPAGLGLDEQAVAAVSRYVFAPARQDGKPVKVDLYVDVNFSIH